MPLHPVARFIGRAVLFTCVNLVILGVTAWLAAFALAYLRGQHWSDSIRVGVICSVVTWLFVAVFHWRKETMLFAVQNRNEFLVEVRAVMSELGYEALPMGADNCRLRFRAGLRSLLLGGSVRLIIDGATARIIGPRVCLEVLRKRLRVRHHVERMQQTMLENSRLLDALQQRIQTGLKLSPQQLRHALDEVIESLAEEGDIVCYLKIATRHENTLPQSTIDARLRDWLKPRGHAAEAPKEPSKHDTLALT